MSAATDGFSAMISGLPMVKVRTSNRPDVSPARMDSMGSALRGASQTRREGVKTPGRPPSLVP